MADRNVIALKPGRARKSPPKPRVAARDKAAAEALWPGTRCTYFAFWGRDAAENLMLWVSLSAPTDNLLSLGLITEEMLASLPPCGFKYFRRGAVDSIRRRGERCVVRQCWQAGEALGMFDRLGLPAPKLEKPEELQDRGPKTAAEWKELVQGTFASLLQYAIDGFDTKGLKPRFIMCAEDVQRLAAIIADAQAEAAAVFATARIIDTSVTVRRSTLRLVADNTREVRS